MRHYAISTLLALALGLGLAAGAVNLAVSAVPAHAATAKVDPVFPRGLPHAIREDACVYGVNRCVWDAKHRGNRRGKSYILTRYRGDFLVAYVSHKRAHRLAKAWCQRRDVAC